MDKGVLLFSRSTLLELTPEVLEGEGKWKANVFSEEYQSDENTL
jgi:hypothetical protein